MPKFKVTAPFVGVRTDRDTSTLDITEAEDALNCDLSNGSIRRRLGVSTITLADEVGATYTEVNPVIGMYVFERRTETGEKFLVYKSGALGQVAKLLVFEKFVGATASRKVVAASGTTGLDATQLPSFAELNDRLYIADGEKYVVTDGATTEEVTVAAPSDPTVVTSADGGSTLVHQVGDGVFYSISYYSTTWGVESALSAEVLAQAPTGVTEWSADVILPGVSADSRVDKIRIYRRGLNETVGVYLADADDNTASWFDRGTFTVDSTVIAPPSAELTPKILYLATQSGILYGVEKATNTIYFTRPNSTQWAGFISTQDDDEPITAIYAFSGIIFVFKSDSIWTLSGTDETNFSLQLGFRGIGCRSHHSIVPHKGMIYFLGGDGIYSFDGAAPPVMVSQPIKPTFLKRTKSKDEFCVGGYNHTNDSLLWSFTTSSLLLNNSLWAYFPDNSERTKSYSWCPWDLGRDVRSMASGEPLDVAAQDQSLYFGTDVGRFYSYGAVTDGIPFTWTWRTGKLDGGIPAKIKRWGQLEVEMSKVSTHPIDVRAYIDDEAFNDLGELDPAVRKIFRGRLRRSGRDIRIEFSSENTNLPGEVVSFVLDVRLSGRASG